MLNPDEGEGTMAHLGSHGIGWLVAGYLTACSAGSDPSALVDAGLEALGSGDYLQAAAHFDEAAAALPDDPDNPKWLRARLGAIEARTRLDPQRALREFLEIANEAPERIQADGYARLAGRFLDEEHWQEAEAILEAARTIQPEPPRFDALLDALEKAPPAESRNDSGSVPLLPEEPEPVLIAEPGLTE
jgi:tetratricopeptide (TPR) repeat protein